MPKKSIKIEAITIPQLDLPTLNYLIEFCKKEEDWCLNNSRKMEFGAWGKVIEKLEGLKGGQEE